MSGPGSTRAHSLSSDVAGLGRSEWDGRKVAVTGGASFIGSHLVESLIARGADVSVIDDLSSGRLQNLESVNGRYKFHQIDLEYSGIEEITSAFEGSEVLFHLAAIHGGRGYIDSHPADVCSNLAIDHHVYEAARRADVSQVVFASSACVYPPALQATEGSNYLLREEDCDPRKLGEPLSADLEYGWAKVFGEIQLLARARTRPMRSSP